MINEEFKRQLYYLLVQFIKMTNNRDSDGIKNKFSINEEVFEEIIENLGEYFGKSFIIDIAPYQKAFEKHRNHQNIDIYEINEHGVFSVECIILFNGKPQEAILHAEVFGKIEDLKLRYKYIDS